MKKVRNTLLMFIVLPILAITAGTQISEGAQAGEQKEKHAYLKKVVLYSLKAKYFTTLLEKKIPGVEFKLKNKGNRTLKEVEVTVYFKDKKGTVIAEAQYYPVLVSEYSFGRENRPLKPNYIWQMERGHFYQAPSVPTEWEEGAISAKVTNIEFSKKEGEK